MSPQHTNGITMIVVVALVVAVLVVAGPRRKHDDEPADLREEVARLGQMVDELQVSVDLLARKVDSLAPESPAPPSDDRADALPPQIEARVEDVDSATGIVILSVGAEDNVKQGMTFYVHRDINYVAQVKVERVYTVKCSARVQPGTGTEEVRPGDRAVSGLSRPQEADPGGDDAGK